MNDIKKPVQSALEQLEELQSFESSYSQINKFQTIINTFANLEHVCEMMAEEIAQQENRKCEEVMADFFEKAGLN